MRVGNFSLLIPEGVEQDSGHVRVPHGTQYTLRMGNHTPSRCDAEVTIDGVVVGVFRLGGYQTSTLERKPDDRGRFTFYASGTAEAGLVGEGTVRTDERGLVQVRFTPEKPRPAVLRPTSVMRSWGGIQGQAVPAFAPDPSEKTVGGITGLSGHSSQEFTSVRAIDLDHTAAVTISVRLVCGQDPSTPRPLVSRGNSVPPPV